MLRYPFTAFAIGFVVMSVELMAARIVAPIIGASVFTWTSIIGIILLGITLGNYFGGRIIDKNPSGAVLGKLLLFSSFFTALIPLFSKFAPLIILWETGLLIKILVISALLFLMPAVFLGAVYPCILKLYAKNPENLGKSAGLIAGLNALGGILGTFLTGFFFAGIIGSSLSFYLLSFVLLFSALAFEKKINAYFWVVFLAILILLFFHYYRPASIPGLVYEGESAYYKIRVIDGSYRNLPARILFLDFDSHSLESPDNKKFGIYPEIGPLFQAFKENLKEILVIGGGSYNLPKNLNRTYQTSVSVAEIDPAVTKTAENFFNLNSGSIKTINLDGRVYLAQSSKTYDLIFGDAFNSFISIPWHLATNEANNLIKTRLNPGGIYAVNFISALTGKEGLWYQSMAKTFSQTFPNYYAFNFSIDPSQPQSIILVGINSDEKINEKTLKTEITKLKQESGGRLTLQYKYRPQITGGSLILTDDFAPIENLTASLINSYFNSYSNWFYNFN